MVIMIMVVDGWIDGLDELGWMMMMMMMMEDDDYAAADDDDDNDDDDMMMMMMMMMMMKTKPIFTGFKFEISVFYTCSVVHDSDLSIHTRL